MFNMTQARYNLNIPNVSSSIRGLFCSTRLLFVLIVLELEASFFGS